VVLLDADIAGGTGAHHFRKAFPERFFQFGIAEQNMMAAAGGMAAAGLIPMVTTFAVFCLRAFEQARLAAYAGRNIKIVASHPGLDVGPDGGSAQALEDLAAFRAIPGMTVVSPADPVEMGCAMRAILDHKGPVYMRTGRSPARRLFAPGHRFELGKGQVLREGVDVTIVACGVEVARALDAADILARQNVEARVVNMPTIKPLDTDLLAACARETGCFVTAEDHNVFGGLGSAVAEALARRAPAPIEFVGAEDRFGESGEPEELAERYGLTAPHIAAAAHRAVARKRS
jgi:transketolase